MTGPVPDAGTDPAGYVLAIADMAVADVEAPRDTILKDAQREQIRFIYAQVALWRGIVERHRPVVLPRFSKGSWCRRCSGVDDTDAWPCPDLLGAVAAAQAYQGGAG